VRPPKSRISRASLAPGILVYDESILGDNGNRTTRRMTYKAKDLSPDQKTVIESLLGRSISENEEISIRATAAPTAPGWLQASWESAQEQGLDRLSMEEIDAEIDAARKARREPRSSQP
jgi:hypothetical protein